MSEKNKVGDLLDQKVEEQAHFLDNTHALLAYGKIPSALFLLTKTVSFYAKNFWKIFVISNFYFVLIFSAFLSQLIYFRITIFIIIIPLLLMLLYVCTLANLVLEEEDDTWIIIKYALAELIPVLYSCLVFVVAICGFAVLSFIPEFLFMILMPNSHLFRVIGGVIFAILLIAAFVWYSLFLFVSVDESQYGFKSLFRSKAYVEVNFPDFLRRLVICIAAVPVIFALLIFSLDGVLAGLDVFNNFFDISYQNYYAVRDVIENQITAQNFNIDEQYSMLKSWFIKIVFVIPFITIYLGFLYSTLSCENPLPTSFYGSVTHKILLGLFFVIGGLAILIFCQNGFIIFEQLLQSPSQLLNSLELKLY